MIDLHLKIEQFPSNCVLAWVVELDVLSIPFYCLSHLVVRCFSGEYLPEVAIYSVSEVSLSIDLGEDS